MAAPNSDIVPIQLSLTSGDLITLWAPRWREDGEEWEAFLGDDDSLFAFPDTAALAAFVRTADGHDLCDHPAWPIVRQLSVAELYYIYLGSRDQDRGQKAVEQLKAEGINDVELLLIDVTSEASVQKAHDELAAKINHLDVLINNAGIPGSFPQKADTVSDDTMKEVFEVNFFGVIRTVRIFIDLVKKSPNPRIVNVTSDLGSLTYHNDPEWEHYEIKSAAYGPSKTALNAYTVALAYDLKDQVKVNMVNPGYTNTEFNGNRGPKPVEDGAAPIVKYAMIGTDGPTGKFFSDYGESPW